jgi:glycosyltransferase involved in cell wall biosynthesis
VRAGAVRIHVATYNTAAATELCVRTIHRYAGHPFELVVGDSGSTDASIPRLRRFARDGWLELEEAPGGRRHAEWLNHWNTACDAQYAVFVDSDMEFLRAGWLADLVAAAREHNAALVTSRIQTLEGERYVDAEGRRMYWAPRPTPWLMLVDLNQTRAAIETGFGFRYRDDPQRPGERIAFDTGAAYFDELQSAGLRWVAMPDEWSGCFHHFGAMTRVQGGNPNWRGRLKRYGKERWVDIRLLGARVRTRRPSAQYRNASQPGGPNGSAE